MLLKWKKKKTNETEQFTSKHFCGSVSGPSIESNTDQSDIVDLIIMRVENFWELLFPFPGLYLEEIADPLILNFRK